MIKVDLSGEDPKFIATPNRTNLDWYGTLEEKPQIEQDLFRLQDEYYDAKAQKDLKKENRIFNEMLSLVITYARSMYLKKITGKRFVDPDEVIEVAQNQAITFMEQYIFRPGYYLEQSFGGTLEYKVREAKIKKEAAEGVDSLNSLIDMKDRTKEMGDLQGIMNFNFVSGGNYEAFENFEENIINLSVFEKIQEILKEYDQAVEYNPKQMLIVRFWLAILLRIPTNRHGKASFKKYIARGTKYRKALDLFELELYRMLSGN